MHPVLEALEEQVVLLRLLGDANETVKVRIGSEQSETNLRSTSLVTVGYGSDSSPLGALELSGQPAWIMQARWQQFQPLHDTSVDS